MKQKSTTYLLLIVAVVIWGIIIFRIIKSRKGNDFQDNGTQTEIPVLTSQSDSVYTLQLNYSDPFLKGLKTTAPQTLMAPPITKVTNPVASRPEKKPVSLSVITVWPKIGYNGFIVNETGKLGHFVLNGRIYYLKENQVISGIEIVYMLRDSVRVQYKKQIKWIKRK